ncbi:MAG: hypothetical protein AAF543_22765, partial [Pseudomonadota bacterium]
ELVVSARLAERAGADLSAFDTRPIEIRGRKRPLRVHVVEDATSLPSPGPNDEGTLRRSLSISKLLSEMKLT